MTLASGRTVGYDYLVYAAGSGSADPGVPGAEFAYPIATLEAAQRLWPILGAAPATAAVTVVGGAPARDMHGRPVGGSTRLPAISKDPCWRES